MIAPNPLKFDHLDDVATISLLKDLPSPDFVGSTEYRAVYEMLADCKTLDEACAACEELICIASFMLVKINKTQSNQ